MTNELPRLQKICNQSDQSQSQCLCDSCIHLQANHLSFILIESFWLLRLSYDTKNSSFVPIETEILKKKEEEEVSVKRNDFESWYPFEMHLENVSKEEQQLNFLNTSNGTTEESDTEEIFNEIWECLGEDNKAKNETI